MIERNIARIALPKMLVGLFVARVDDDQMEESHETTKEARCSRRDSPAYFLPHPNLVSLISGSCFNPSAILCQLLHSVGDSGTYVLSAFRDGVARILRDVRGLVSGVLHSLGNGDAGALSAPFNTETLLGTV